MATAISIEASELNELFLWKTVEQSADVDRERIKEELADVVIYALLLANRTEIDLKKAVLDKISKNALKYPADIAKGNSRKYNEL